jgi:hypothetical protein
LLLTIEAKVSGLENLRGAKSNGKLGRRETIWQEMVDMFEGVQGDNCWKEAIGGHTGSPANQAEGATPRAM